jgi:addiction module RelE/StbE family toxin
MQILYSEKFKKQFRKLSNQLKDTVEVKIQLLKANPFDQRLKTHKLKGELAAYYAFSVNNKYRIIFQIDEHANIKLHYVGNHDIYE